MRRVLCALAALVAVVPAGGAGAAPPREQSGSYQAQAPVPEPVTQVLALRPGLCNPALASAKHEQELRVPFPGRLTVQLDGFTGDWALGVFDRAGEPYATSDQFVTDGPLDTPEEVTLLLRKPGTVVVLRACNLAGGPTATVRYVFRGLSG